MSLIAIHKTKLPIVILAAAFVTLCSAKAFEHANFTGDWKLDESKSDLGQFGGRMASRTIKITNYADSVTFDITSKNMQGDDVKRTERLTFDGKESSIVLSPNASKKSTAKWSDDGKSLNVNSVVSFTRDGQTTEIKVTEVWTLSADGSTLNVQSNSSSSFGESSMTLVYTKGK
jgi:hypothetical protein